MHCGLLSGDYIYALHVHFDYPHRWPPDTVQPGEVAVHDKDAERANRRLRLALCAHWKKVADFPSDELCEQCARIRKQLQAEEHEEEKEADTRAT